MVRRHNQRRVEPFQIMQVNVGRSSSTHDIALHLANENRMDVLLIQEPWTYRDLSKQRTKTHKLYVAFSPLATKSLYLCSKGRKT